MQFIIFLSFWSARVWAYDPIPCMDKIYNILKGQVSASRSKYWAAVVCGHRNNPDVILSCMSAFPEFDWPRRAALCQKHPDKLESIRSCVEKTKTEKVVFRGKQKSVNPEICQDARSWEDAKTCIEYLGGDYNDEKKIRFGFDLNLNQTETACRGNTKEQAWSCLDQFAIKVDGKYEMTSGGLFKKGYQKIKLKDKDSVVHGCQDFDETSSLKACAEGLEQSRLPSSVKQSRYSFCSRGGNAQELLECFQIVEDANIPCARSKNISPLEPEFSAKFPVCRGSGIPDLDCLKSFGNANNSVSYCNDGTYPLSGIACENFRWSRRRTTTPAGGQMINR